MAYPSYPTPKSEVVAFLSKTFNAKAADTKAIIAEYKAAFTQIIPGEECYTVRGVAENKIDEFIEKFKKLPGVDGIYKKANAAPAGYPKRKPK